MTTLFNASLKADVITRLVNPLFVATILNTGNVCVRWQRLTPRFTKKQTKRAGHAILMPTLFTVMHSALQRVADMPKRIRHNSADHTQFRSLQMVFRAQGADSRFYLFNYRFSIIDILGGGTKGHEVPFKVTPLAQIPSPKIQNLNIHLTNRPDVFMVCTLIDHRNLSRTRSHRRVVSLSCFEHLMASFLWSIRVQTMKKYGRVVFDK